MTTRTAADALEQMPAPYSNATAEGYGDWCAAMLSWALHWQDVIRAALATPQPLTDAQIVEIRDDHLPSQGEPFDCIAFARAILNASSHEHVYCPHCRPCKHSERVDAYDGVLRGLASYLSAGGFNSTGLIDPEVADAKIRWGIDNFVKVEVDRLLRATQSAAPAQEPVAWRVKDFADGWILVHTWPEAMAEAESAGNTIQPLYAAPPPPAPAQEPVATLEAKVSTLLARALTTGYGSTEAIYALANLAREPLFAAPPPDEAREWIALTDEDRQAAFQSMPDMLEGFLKTWGWLHFAKEIERRCREKNK